MDLTDNASTLKIENDLNIFTINYQTGIMTLHLENFFERKNNGKFVNKITKPKICKVLFPLIRENCSDELETLFLEWLKTHSCSDLAETYISKYLAQ